MFRNLLVPLDGSPFSEHALPFARGIARLLLGSVADKVLRGAMLPVLIARPQGGSA